MNWPDSGPRALCLSIWVGAGRGTLIGILGGVFGIYADVNRARIRRLPQDLNPPCERTEFSEGQFADR